MLLNLALAAVEAMQVAEEAGQQGAAGWHTRAALPLCSHARSIQQNARWRGMDA